MDILPAVFISGDGQRGEGDDIESTCLIEGQGSGALADHIESGAIKPGSASIVIVIGREGEAVFMSPFLQEERAVCDNMARLSPAVTVSFYNVLPQGECRCKGGNAGEIDHRLAQPDFKRGVLNRLSPSA